MSAPPFDFRMGALENPGLPHFDGRRFFNPWQHDSAPSTLAVIAWQLRRKPRPWPVHVPLEPRLQPFPAKGEIGTIAARFVGHASWLLQLGEYNFLLDPVWSERPSPFAFAGPRRVQAPGLTLSELPPIHGVLISHNHYDHLDLSTLLTIERRFKPLVITGLGNAAWLRRGGLARVVELDWWGQMAFGSSSLVTFTPARHWSNRLLVGKNTTLWGGFSLHHQQRHIYFAGDSGYAPFFQEIRQRLGAPDLALLPIGAYDPRALMAPVHMNPAEAVRAHQDLSAARSIGIHHRTWRLTDEGYDEPAADLEKALERAGISPAQFHPVDAGSTVILPPLTPSDSR